MNCWLTAHAMIDGYDQLVIVNLDCVRYCQSMDNGETTRCVFSEDETLVIHVPFPTMQTALIAGRMP